MGEQRIDELKRQRDAINNALRTAARHNHHRFARDCSPLSAPCGAPIQEWTQTEIGDLHSALDKLFAKE